MLRAAISIQLCVFELFVQKFPLPNRMSIVFNVIDEQSWYFKLPKPLYVATDRPVHNQKLGDIGILVGCIEDSSSPLRVPKHSEVVLVVEGREDFLEKLKWEGLDCFLASS